MSSPNEPFHKLPRDTSIALTPFVAQESQESIDELGRALARRYPIVETYESLDCSGDDLGVTKAWMDEAIKEWRIRFDWFVRPPYSYVGVADLQEGLGKAHQRVSELSRNHRVERPHPQCTFHGSILREQGRYTRSVLSRLAGLVLSELASYGLWAEIRFLFGVSASRRTPRKES